MLVSCISPSKHTFQYFYLEVWHSEMYGYSCELPGATGVVVVRGYRTRTSYKSLMALQKERVKCFGEDSAARVSSNLR